MPLNKNKQTKPKSVEPLCSQILWNNNETDKNLNTVAVYYLK